MQAIDATQALAWLGWLYRSTASGWLTLFGVDATSGTRRTAWTPVDHPEALADTMATLAERGDLWFGVAPRRERLDNGQRGGVADCLSIPAFWLDVDIAGEGHKLPGLPADINAAVDLVKRCPLTPSAVVRSGYGLQCWWVLAEPMGAVEASGLLPRWQATWERLAGDWHVDNVSNLDRVMRLPGSLNWKGTEPRPVTVRLDEGRLYHPSDIEEWLDPPAEPEARHRAFTAHLAGSRFNEAVKAETILDHLGWALIRTDRNGDQHWHHPGSANDVSATVYADDGHTAIWSETVAVETGAPLRRPEPPFGLWTWLRHHGDFVASHADVARAFPDLGSEADMAKLFGPDPLTTPAPATAIKRLHVANSGKVTPMNVEWIWPGWLPTGKLIALDGDPDAGKSTLTLDLAARVSTGGIMPDGSGGGAPAAVTLLAAEDDLADTIVWRLMAAGANRDLIHYVQAVSLDGEEAPFTIPGDLGLLEEHVRATGSALVIVDVLEEYLDSRVDTYKNHDIRRVLHVLRGLAERTRASVIMLRHLRKEGSTKAIYRGQGSIGIVGAARAGWTIGYHPDDEGLRVLATTKMNLAPRPTPLGFRLMPHAHFPCAFVAWAGEVRIGADELLNPTPKVAEDPDTKSQIDMAMDALRQILAEGEHWSHEVLEACKGLGLPARTVERARGRLGVKARQVALKDETGVKKGWLLSLPHEGTR